MNSTQLSVHPEIKTTGILQAMIDKPDGLANEEFSSAKKVDSLAQSRSPVAFSAFGGRASASASMQKTR